MDILKKVLEIKERIPYFLEQQYTGSKQGYFKYSYSGDLYGDKIDWGLGNASMALKLAYTIGLDKHVTMVQDTISYVKAFEHKDGYLFDELIYRKSFMRNLIHEIGHGRCDNLANIKYKRAESRQGASALLLFDEFPQHLPMDMDFSKEWIGNYLKELDWRYPWDAGSHFSHLLFYLNLFYRMNRLSEEEYVNLRGSIIAWVSGLQNKDTGSWYIKNPSQQQKINGAMKVITGYNIINYRNIEYSERLIDLCLDNINNEQACDNFNIIYVLYYASLNCPGYRQREIEEFAERRFVIYLSYYYENQGGFSFRPDGANRYYYNARISRGKRESDIHGTTLFMWGIAVISKILNINDQVKIYEFKA